jgi:hypothetical protein
VANAQAWMPLMWLRLIRQYGICTLMPPSGNGTTLKPCGRLKGIIQGRMKFNHARLSPEVRALARADGRFMVRKGLRAMGQRN